MLGNRPHLFVLRWELFHGKHICGRLRWELGFLCTCRVRRHDLWRRNEVGLQASRHLTEDGLKVLAAVSGVVAAAWRAEIAGRADDRLNVSEELANVPWWHPLRNLRLVGFHVGLVPAQQRMLLRRIHLARLSPANTARCSCNSQSWRWWHLHPPELATPVNSMDDASLTQVDVYPKSHAFAIHPRVFLVEHLDGILQDTGNPLAIAKVAIHVTVVLLLVLIVAFVLILVAFVLAIMPVMLSLLTICIHLIHLSAFLVFVFILLEGFVTSFSHLLVVILFLLVILNSRDLYGLLVPRSKLLSSKRLVYVSFHANDVEDPRGPFRIQRLTA